MEHFLRNRWRDLDRLIRRMTSRPEFLPLSLGTVAGIAVAYFLTSFAAIQGGPRTLVFLLYSFGLPSAVLLALRNHHMARGLGLALAWGAMFMLGARVAFDLISLPSDSDLRSTGTAYLGLLASVMALVREVRQRGGGGPEHQP